MRESVEDAALKLQQLLDELRRTRATGLLKVKLNQGSVVEAYTDLKRI